MCSSSFKDPAWCGSDFPAGDPRWPEPHPSAWALRSHSSVCSEARARSGCVPPSAAAPATRAHWVPKTVRAWGFQPQHPRYLGQTLLREARCVAQGGHRLGTACPVSSHQLPAASPPLRSNNQTPNSSPHVADQTHPQKWLNVTWEQPNYFWWKTTGRVWLRNWLFNCTPFTLIKSKKQMWWVNRLGSIYNFWDESKNLDWLLTSMLWSLDYFFLQGLRMGWTIKLSIYLHIIIYLLSSSQSRDRQTRTRSRSRSKGNSNSRNHPKLFVLAAGSPH